jgi:predicted Zn-dependent protease
MTSRLRIVCATCCCFWLLLFSSSTLASEKWTSVRSQNFLLVGNASEKDIRRVGIRLEQFREVVSRLFINLNVSTSVPTTVIVFKDDDSYRPFKPSENTAGFFQAGTEVNYITLKLLNDVRTDQDPFTIIFHEYTHLLVRNTNGRVPLWLNEGLAEYYSTFSINGQNVAVGRPIPRHAYLLSENRMLPLRTLFAVDQKSPYYNETDKQGIFYAQAWALVHYLMSVDDGQRMKQVGKFLQLLAAKIPADDAFQQAFGMGAERMEVELRNYIQRDRYLARNEILPAKVTYTNEMQTSILSEAEAQAYLGDLLLKSDRPESETYLKRALTLDPNLPMANASLGLLRVRQGKPDEARASLERAVAASSQNYLIHYYYAFALSREGNRDMQSVMGFAPGTAATMRRELKRAIELRPDFLQSYSLLAFVNLVTETDLDETIAMLKNVLTAAPERLDLVFMLAQIHLRKHEFKSARELIDTLKSSADAEMRLRGERLLSQVVAVEEQAERISRERAETAKETTIAEEQDGVTKLYIIHPYDPVAALRESLRSPGNGETQTQGLLMRVDCDAKAIVFVVKVGERLLKLNTDDIRHVEFRSFSDDAHGHITCGARKPENNVVVAYVASADARPKSDGVIKSVEFVPADFKLKP